MKKYIFLACLFFVAACQQNQTFVLRVYVPPDQPTQAVFLAGNINQWNPADSSYQLEPIKEGFYEITLPTMNKELEYKYTQGHWEDVEADITQQEITNRKLAPETEGVVKDTIAQWKKEAHKRPSSRSANVHIISEAFAMPQLGRDRRIWLYLPPLYDTDTTKTFPVLYLQDGQNLFDQATAFGDEWDVDGTLNNMAENHGAQFIVVGIENGEEKRLDEYSPFINPKLGGGEGRAYADFLVHTLKPFIDQNYRTKTIAEHTAIGGSSMGGLISFYAALRHPQVFGKALVFSPAFHFSNKFFELPLELDKKVARPKIYLLGGTKESANMVPKIRVMEEKLMENGWDRSMLKVKIVVGATHTERFWRDELRAAVDWLYEVSQ